MADEPTIAVSLSWKRNLGNYNSAEGFISMSGIKAGMTAEEMAPLLDTGKIAWDMIKDELVKQMKHNDTGEGV